MKHIVIINGIGRSGKDTFVEICQGILKPLHIPVYNLSSIDPVKDAAEHLGLPRNPEHKSDAVREFWYDIKMAWVKYNDGPFNYLRNNIEKHSEGVFFLHIREVNEIEKVVKAFPGTIKLEVSRDNADELFNHADTQVRKINYDLEIKNNGTIEELKQKAEDFLFKDLKVRIAA